MTPLSEEDIFPDSLRNIVAEKLGKERTKEMTALDELGLFSESVPERHLNPIDTLVPHLTKALAYSPGYSNLIRRIPNSERRLILL